MYLFLANINKNYFLTNVFVAILATSLGTGMVSTRTTGSSASMLIIESLFGTVVALSNIIIIIVIISGWSKLMKVFVKIFSSNCDRTRIRDPIVYNLDFLQYNFYVIVTNLTLFTSFKAVVEIGFILPYYVMQADGKKPVSIIVTINIPFFIRHLDTFHQRMNTSFSTFRCSLIMV